MPQQTKAVIYVCLIKINILKKYTSLIRLKMKELTRLDLQAYAF